MTDLEDTLRLMLMSSTDALPERPVHGAQAWRRGRVRHRQRVLTGAGAGVLVVAGGASVVPTFRGHESHTATATATVAAAADQASVVSPSPSSASTGRAICPGIPEDAATVDASVDAVCLPDPAPGFPIRIEDDVTAHIFGPKSPNESNANGTTVDGKNHPSRGFSLAMTPFVVTSQTATSSSTAATGPTASVVVSTVGAFATSPATDGTVNGDPVIARVTVHGQPGYVVQREPDMAELFFADGPLVVQISGTDSTYNAFDGTTAIGPDLPTDELVALGNSLQNLP